jgi:hypothetical protein
MSSQRRFCVVFLEWVRRLSVSDVSGGVSCCRLVCVCVFIV